MYIFLFQMDPVTWMIIYRMLMTIIWWTTWFWNCPADWNIVTMYTGKPNYWLKMGLIDYLVMLRLGLEGKAILEKVDSLPLGKLDLLWSANNLRKLQKKHNCQENCHFNKYEESIRTTFWHQILRWTSSMVHPWQITE